MKFLCLHGRGTSGEVFEFQTESFRHLLPDHYTFTFPDAENTCPAAPGVDKLFRGPFTCWYPDDSVKSVAEQHELISEIIADEGPFDAIMGFSQGAALAASIILHHQISNPGVPPLFRSAIFISSFRPFSCLPNLGIDITDAPTTYAPALLSPPTSTSKSTLTSTSTPSPDPPTRSSYLPSLSSLFRSPSPKHLSLSLSSPPTTNSVITDTSTSFLLNRCLWFDPALLPDQRIRIPTAHIYGSNDEFITQAVEVVKLSERGMASVYVHGGGHDVPMDERVSRAIRDVIVKTVERGVGMW